MSVWRGEALTMEIWGGSHDPAIGLRLTGLPAGEKFSLSLLQAFLDRRAPGHSPLTTARRESDEPEFTEGLEMLPAAGRAAAERKEADAAAGRREPKDAETADEFVLTGAPLAVLIRNRDARSGDYEALRTVPRPGHADFAAWGKYQLTELPAGGGAFSGRLTAPYCVGGGIALQLLAQRGIRVESRLLAVGGETRPEAFAEAVAAARAEEDSLGGLVEVRVTGLPIGLGGPLFQGLEGRLALLLFAIPGIKGVEFGEGFAAAKLKGSENNDPYRIGEAGRPELLSNHAGGILGGISDGMPLVLRIAVKPTPSIGRPQKSVDLRKMTDCELRITGRHDACIALRVLPVAEAAAALGILDAMKEEGRL